MTTHTLSENDLCQFSGSEHWYRHGLVRNVAYTDGAQYVAEHGGAYWLLDVIAIAQMHDKAVKPQPFQVWTLKVHGDRKGTVTCDTGNGKELYRQELEYTDFPLPEMKLYCCADGVLGQGIDRVILLPSEY
jgi:hypothetical protein